jgi:hypothetical protein
MSGADGKAPPAAAASVLPTAQPAPAAAGAAAAVAVADNKGGTAVDSKSAEKSGPVR